ncbi:hypothetical protein V3C99_005837 [Haemonchus contortus]
MCLFRAPDYFSEAQIKVIPSNLRQHATKRIKHSLIRVRDLWTHFMVKYINIVNSFSPSMEAVGYYFEKCIPESLKDKG